ncbi:MAG: penicillin-binding transpeptidase domain-containing protein [bacterium]|nr:penicillin-binding transpeptidase domain-containing protein [bacterium]
MKKKTELNLEDILTDRAAVNDLLEVPVKPVVFRICFLVILLAVLTAASRLFSLNVFKADFYQRRALANISEIDVQKSERGIIFDRYGKPLVKNKPIFNAVLVPSQLPKDGTEKKTALNKIAEILNLATGALDKIFKESDLEFANRILLASDLPQSKAVALQGANLAGLQIENDWQRDYQGSEAFSHLLGYVGLVTKNDLTIDPDLVSDDLVGKSGLEAYYDNQLRGENGMITSFRNAKGKILAENLTKQSEPGQPLKTFIDADLQNYFYNRLKQELKKLGRDIGVGIAIDPRNGEILAMVSVPGFDANDIVDSLNQPNQPFFNRAIAGLYAPGSTIKPLVAVAALNEKIIDTKKEIFSSGRIEIPNPYHPDQPSVFLDWKANGWVNLYSAIARSCNIYFYALGGGLEDINGLGITKLRDYWQRFGLGAKTNIDLVGEKAGVLPVPSSDWRLGDTYNVSIGQGDLLVTPLQLVNHITAIANGGKIYQPRIAQTESKTIEDLSYLKADFSEVEKGMIDATQKPYGTAYLLNDLPFVTAAKTGTAQINFNTKVNALFVGYGPVPDPQVAIMVLVENAREGSLNVVPIAKDVFRWYYENRIIK